MVVRLGAGSLVGKTAKTYFDHERYTMTVSRLASYLQLIALAAASAGSLISCGPEAENSAGYPVKPNQLNENNYDPKFKPPAGDLAALKRWDDLSAALGLKEIDSTDLNTLSPTTTTKLADLETPIGLMLQQYGPTLHEARCASIEAMRELTAAADATGGALPAKVYLMAFKRNTAAGAASTTINYGLAVVPTDATANKPLVVFGHPGSGTLDYTHIAGLLSTLQAGTIVLAPAFHGENIALAGTAVPNTTAGTLSPANLFNADADIMLGMLDCVTMAMATAQLGAGGHPTQKNVLDQAGASTGVTTGALFGTRAKALDSTLVGQNAGFGLPRTMFVGADYGGLTTNLALAKAGTFWGLYALKDMGAVEGFETAAAGASALWTQLGLTDSDPKPTVGCAATLAAPASPVHGEYRVALRYSVTGDFASTVFAAIPFAGVMNNLVASYNDGTWNATQAATEFMKRDALYNAPLQLLALRDWRTALIHKANAAVEELPGKALFLHSVGDTAVFTNQTAMLSGVLAQASTELSKEGVGLAPGALTVALGVTPKAGVTDPASIHILEGFSGGKPLTAAASKTTADFTTSDTGWSAIESANEGAALASPAAAFGAWYAGRCGL